jgi:hypothetical protein
MPGWKQLVLAGRAAAKQIEVAAFVCLQDVSEEQRAA